MTGKPNKAPKDEQPGKPVVPVQKPEEIGGPAGPDPIRYGDWEINGKCVDF